MKLCKIVERGTTWKMLVDGHSLCIPKKSIVLYFMQLYEKLGYTVVTVDRTAPAFKGG